MKRVQRFWSSWHEAIEVVIVGSIFSVGANLLRVVGNNIASQREIDLRTHTRNMTSAFEIDGLTWLQLTQSADYPESWIMPMAILINLATLYFTVRNDELILAIRVIATGESFNRLGYMLVKTTVDFCGFFVDPQCTNIPFVKPIVRDINKVLLINMFLQMIISFSRFMAVSFGGRYFSYAHKWPFAQLAVGYVLAAGAIVLTKHLWDIYLFDYWGILATITVCFMVTMDCFTFRAFRNWKKAKPDAERRLMYQMMCSSLIYLIDYVGTNVFVILTIEFDLTGPTLTSLILSYFSLTRMVLYTLGQSLIGLIFLRKKKRKAKKKDIVADKGSTMVDTSKMVSSKNSNRTFSTLVTSS